jgi:hypothetical protein
VVAAAEVRALDQGEHVPVKWCNSTRPSLIPIGESGFYDEVAPVENPTTAQPGYLSVGSSPGRQRDPIWNAILWR